MKAFQTKRTPLGESSPMILENNIVQDLLGRKVHLLVEGVYREGRVSALQCVVEWDTGEFSVGALENIAPDGQPLIDFTPGLSCQSRLSCCLHKTQVKKSPGQLAPKRRNDSQTPPSSQEPPTKLLSKKRPSPQSSPGTSQEPAPLTKKPKLQKETIPLAKIERAPSPVPNYQENNLEKQQSIVLPGIQFLQPVHSALTQITKPQLQRQDVVVASSRAIKPIVSSSTFVASSNQPIINNKEQQNAYQVQQFPSSDITREKEIAHGTFGAVFIGTVKGISGQVAIKDMKVQNPSSVAEWKKEVKVMSRTRSKFIVDIYGYTYLEEKLSIIMELMINGDLYHVLHKNAAKHPLSKLHKLRMSLHCIKGLSFLHNQNILHRDIKSMNILVTEDYSCKLTDFGCAKLMIEGNPLNTVNKGSPLWMAPEVKSGQYSFPADVYSMGLVFFEIFEQRLPGYDGTLHRATLPPTFSSKLIISPLVDVVPGNRPTANDVEILLQAQLSKAIHGIRALLSSENLTKLKNDAGTKDLPEEDCVQKEMETLYQQLLRKSPSEIDYFFR